MNINRFFITLFLATLTLSAISQNVKINEIMYNFGYNLDKLEAGNWVELYNTTSTPVNITGWQVKFGDATYTVPNYNLPANEYVLVTSKDSLMKANYPALTPIILGDTILGGLDDNSEQIQILNAAGAVIDSLTYFDKGQWPECADGKAQSLALNSTSANNNNPANWECSGVLGGTPGAPNTNNICPTSPQNIIINEINYKSDSLNDPDDWIELYNASGAPVNLSNWILYDTDSLYKFPQGTWMSAASYLVVPSRLAKFTGFFSGIDASSYVGLSSLMSLSGDGETITLADSNNCRVHRMKYNDSAPWPESPDGGGPTLSLINENYNNKVAGSWAPSTAASSAPYGTPGQPNNIPDPCAGNTATNLVINEINYNSSANENPGNWLELYNAGSSSINLSGYKINNEGEQFNIPLGETIGPGEYLVLADSVEQFMVGLECPSASFLNVDAELNFSNNGDLVSVYNFKTQDYGCLVDSVRYNDKAPWPPQADGGGYTLELLNPNSDNTDPLNWAASNYTLGSPGLANQQASPTICDCDFTYKIYSGNSTFQTNDVIFASDSIDFFGTATFFGAGKTLKFYAGKSIEVKPFQQFTIDNSSTVLFDIDNCQ